MSDWRSAESLFPDDDPAFGVWSRDELENRLRLRKKAEKEVEPREEADREGEGTSG